jgi:hypothetical protein
MARIYKESQVQGTASTSTYATLYTTPAITTANISTIAVCNTAASVATYRIAIMSSAGTPAASNWLVYDASVPANDTVFLTIGISLSAAKFIRISSSANTVTFTAFVSEVS